MRSSFVASLAPAFSRAANRTPAAAALAIALCWASAPAVSAPTRSATPTPLPAVDPELLAVCQLDYEWINKLPVLEDESLIRIAARDENIYCLSDDKRLYVVHADLGSLRWTRKLTKRTYRVFGPLHHQDFVYFVAGNRLLKLERDTGRIASQIDLTFPASTCPNADDRYYYIGSDDGRIYVIAIDSRQLAWSAKTLAPINARPEVLDDTLLVASEDGTLYATRRNMRQVLWRFKTDQPLVADMYLDREAALCYLPGTDSSLYAIDVGNGKLKWRFRAGAPLYDPPQVTANTIYQATRGAGLYALDRDHGETLRWHVPDGKQFLARQSGSAYILTHQGNIAVVDDATGKQRHVIVTPNLTLFDPNPYDGKIFAATPDGQVVCIRRKDAPFMPRTNLLAATKPEAAAPSSTAPQQPQQQPAPAPAQLERPQSPTQAPPQSPFESRRALGG